MQPIRKPDLSAPRFRKPVTKTVTGKTLKAFKEKHKGYDNVDYNMFKSVIAKHCEKIYQTVINTRDGIELPEGIGYIFIGACPARKKQVVDYKKSFEYGYKVSAMNWETDGTLGKIFFSNYNTKYKIKDREIWAFNAVRQFKREFAQVYPEKWKMYLSIDKSKPVSQLYFNPRKYVDRNLEIKTDDFLLSIYNEFEF
jgi:hypothetical protein